VHVREFTRCNQDPLLAGCWVFVLGKIRSIDPAQAEEGLPAAAFFRGAAIQRPQRRGKDA